MDILFPPVWELGTVRGVHARRCRRTGAVQFRLWEKGEAGYDEDVWSPMALHVWKDFKPTKHDPTK